MRLVLLELRGQKEIPELRAQLDLLALLALRAQQELKALREM